MTAPAVIVFGKLPSRGDFVSRGLDGSTLDAWDGWFSAQLESAKQRLGDDFAATHDAAPPWRFVDPPGAFGPGWRAGAFAPSMDSVGRRFFIMAAADRLSPDQAANGPAVAMAMEDVIYQAFEHGWDADGVIERGSEVVHAALDGTINPEICDNRPLEQWATSGSPTLAPVGLACRPDDVIGRLPDGVIEEIAR